MLAEGSLFALDAGNQRVPGVVVPTLEAGLGLIGREPVASLVGRLRSQLRVVDVDLVGERGHAVVAALASWCVVEGLWHLVRPSGGADGRGHVYVAPGDRLEALEAVLQDLRSQFRAGPRTIDLRTAVRPLSAPHRSGVSTRPGGDLHAALSTLRAVLNAADIQTSRAVTRAAPGVSEPPSSRRSRLAPLRPTCSAIPVVWRAYLEGGIRPPIAGDDTQKRSNYEAIATATLLRAGCDVNEAWSTIQRAHPDAFTKARERGRSWWSRCIWEPAVRAHDRFVPLPHPQAGAAEASAAGVVNSSLIDSSDERLLAAVEAARQAVQATAWTLSPRTRPAFLLVMHTVLDRMLRAGSRRVPVPERDLVLDTGLTDRTTIRAQLRRADGPVGFLDRTAWDPRKRDTSSFEFEIPLAEHPPGDSLEGTGVRQFPPLSSHTPSGSGIGRGVWNVLPPLAHQLWRALDRSREPETVENLGVQAQLVSNPGAALTVSQARTARFVLTALAAAGLATCTEGGRWVARPGLRPEVAAATRERHAAAAMQVDQERAKYRSRAQRGRLWDATRAAALKANLVREVAWWRGLSPMERRTRSTEWAGRYRRLPVYDQKLVKQALAERRVRAGGDERLRHDAWLDGTRSDDLLDRAITRAAWFAALPRPQQQAYAAMWAQHRADYAVPRSTALSMSRMEFAAALPHSPSRRDDVFLRDYLPLGPPGETGSDQQAG